MRMTPRAYRMQHIAQHPEKAKAAKAAKAARKSKKAEGGN